MAGLRVFLHVENSVQAPLKAVILRSPPCKIGVSDLLECRGGGAFALDLQSAGTVLTVLYARFDVVSYLQWTL